MLLAIDPSIRCAGWALFKVSGGRELVAAGTVDQSSDEVMSFRVANFLARFEDQSNWPLACVTDVVLEFPQVYPGSQEENPNDLMPLAAQAGAILYAFGHQRVTLVAPRDWKGNVEKHAHNERVLGRLSPAELARVPTQARSRKYPYNHNMVDAIGIGLHHQGKLEVIHVASVNYEAQGLTVYRRAKPGSGARQVRAGGPRKPKRRTTGG